MSPTPPPRRRRDSSPNPAAKPDPTPPAGGQGATPGAPQTPGAGAGGRGARARRESSPSPAAPATPEGAATRERPKGRERTAKAAAATGAAASVAGKSTVGRVANAAATVADPNATAGEKAKEAVATGAEAAATAIGAAVATPLAGKVAGTITGKVARSKQGRYALMAMLLIPLLGFGGIVTTLVLTLGMANQAATVLVGLAEAEERERNGDNDVCLPTGGAGGGETVGELDAEQTEMSRIIIEVGQEKGVPTYGLVIAIATARQESRIKNIDYGDRDSIGLFQQRPSQGWGTYDQIMDPRYSAGKFYDALLAVPGWEQMEVTVAAQRVQRSGFPDAYAQWESLARSVVEQITGSTVPSAGGGCAGAIADCVALPANVENGLTPDALNVARCTAAQFSIPATSILGLGQRAANPNSDHGSGKAVDFMVADYASSQGVATGDAWAAWLIEHHAELGINYVIWNVKIWVASKADQGWQPYSHPSGATDDNNLHKNHVHVSVHGNAGTGFATGGEVVGGWAFPAKPGAVVTSVYGYRFHPVQGIWKQHQGTDFASAVGDPIYAAAGGTVKSVVSMHPSAGNWVVISHGGGVETGYMHMSRIDVTKGQTVQAGQLLGAAGATGGVTGPHLHFEVIVNGVHTDPVPFLKSKGVY